jgi:hypothetical protein
LAPLRNRKLTSVIVTSWYAFGSPTDPPGRSCPRPPYTRPLAASRTWSTTFSACDSVAVARKSAWYSGSVTSSSGRPLERLMLSMSKVAYSGSS